MGARQKAGVAAISAEPIQHLLSVLLGKTCMVDEKASLEKNMSWLSELLFLCTVLTSCIASHTKMLRCFSLTDSFSLSGF